MKWWKLLGFSYPKEDEVAAIGWFSSSIEERLIKIGDHEKPCHVIAHSSGYPYLVLDYKKMKTVDDKEVDARANEIAEMVYKMTDNWVELIECDIIGNLRDASTEQTLDMVYFGSFESLELPDQSVNSNGETQMIALLATSMHERFMYPDGLAKPIYINVQPECATQHGFNPHETNLVLIPKRDAKPDQTFVRTNSQGFVFSSSFIYEYLNLSTARAYRRWTRRFMFTVEAFQPSVIFFIQPFYLNSADSAEVEWRN